MLERKVMVIKLKRILSETSSCALLAVLASLLLVREAHAYLDPGAGSYIFQILLASLVGALFMLKVFWGRIVGFFSKGSPESKATVQEPGQDVSTPVPANGNVGPTAQDAQSERDDD
ncbi:MAG: hypothetical protein ACETWR_01650 [Anaerolineae bacterium]